ncbi:GAP family protein [Streptomyces sp. NPDC049577]|uniref:GAP family protein n=1 Tax=Streptomyces sp. NPDC049577 TaxID=3155153 RepID=UPI0034449D04
MVADLLVIGLAIAVDPLALTAFVLLLTARDGLGKGLAYILGWLACLVVVVAAVLLLTGGRPPPHRSSPSTTAVAVKLAIGVGLVVYARRKWRRMGAVRTRPSILSRLDRVTVWTAAGLAAFLQPWALVAAGATDVVKADLSHPVTFVALFGFCVLATAGFLAMELYMACSPGSARVRLERMRVRLERHQDHVIVVGALLLGLWLTGRSSYQLTG